MTVVDSTPTRPNIYTSKSCSISCKKVQPLDPLLPISCLFPRPPFHTCNHSSSGHWIRWDVNSNPLSSKILRAIKSIYSVHCSFDIFSRVKVYQKEKKKAKKIENRKKEKRYKLQLHSKWFDLSQKITFHHTSLLFGS